MSFFLSLLGWCINTRFLFFRETTKKEVCCLQNSFQTKGSPSGRSFIKPGECKGSELKPWDLLALKPTRDLDRSMHSSFCKTFTSCPEVVLCCNLNMIPWCYIFSNCFEISRTHF